MRKTGFLIAILILATFLRLYNIGNNPPSAYGDEISFAWNAWNILKTGTDEYGNAWPIQFRAFEDYKAPIPVYLLVPVFKYFGMNTISVRIPVVIFSIFTICMMFFLVKKLTNTNIALITAFLLTISPWHMHLSRGYFESTISLFFLVCAVYFFVLSKKIIQFLYLSAGFFVMTLYTYFTPRIMLLFFLPFLIWWGKEWLFKKKKPIVIFLLIIGLMSLPLIYVSIFDKGLSRINSIVDITNSKIEKDVNKNLLPYKPQLLPFHRIFHNKPLYWIREVTNNYLEHFSINFWYLYGDNSIRYFLGSMGMFYLAELPFLIFGIYYFFSKYRNNFWLFLGWLFISPIPAAISGRPFAVRSLVMLPAALVFPAAGLVFIWQKLYRNHILQLLAKILIVILFILNFSYYFIRYHEEYPLYAANWWGWENKAAIDLAIKNKDNYDQIFISNFYSGLNLALAYYLSYDPLKYRLAKENPIFLADGRKFIKLDKFYIGSLDIDEKRKNAGIIPPKSLYIGRPEEADSAETINALDDDRNIFKVYRTD